MKYLAGDALANVPVLWAAMRYLQVVGPQSERALFESLRPKAVIAGEPASLVASLSVGENLELVRVNRSEWSVDASLEGDWFESVDTFRSLVRRRLFLRAHRD